MPLIPPLDPPAPTHPDPQHHSVTVGSSRVAVVGIFTSRRSADATNQGLGGGRDPVVKHLPSHHWDHYLSSIIYVADFICHEQVYQILRNYSVPLSTPKLRKLKKVSFSHYLSEYSKKGESGVDKAVSAQ